MEVMCGFSNMTFHSPRLTWLSPLLSAQSPSSRNEHWDPDLALFHRVIRKLPDNELIILDLFHHGRATFCPYWNRHLLWKWNWLVCMQCFFQNYHLLTYRMVSPLSWCGTQHCCRSKNSLHSKGSTGMDLCLWIHWSHHVLHHPDAANLIEWWNGLLKFQLQCQLRDNMWQGWDKVLEKLV